MAGKFDFTVDLPFGQEAERYVRDMLRSLVCTESPLKVEVKRDDRALTTGHVYLEHHQNPRNRGYWIPSGLKDTEADLFAVVVGDAIIAAPANAWRYVGNKYGDEVSTGGDNPTKGRRVALDGLPRRLAEAPFEAMRA